MIGDIQRVCTSLGLEVSPAQVASLARYLELLRQWNSTYNLTALRDSAAMLSHHLADCLAVIAPLRTKALPGRLLDVGSGGGLPGAVIAAALPDWQVTCVDAVGKKMAFVRQVAGALPLLNLHAEHSRIENLQAEPFHVITSRAFATLSEFTSLTRKHLRADGVWMAMKGRRPDDEIALLPADVCVFHVEQLHVPDLDAQRCVVWMRKQGDA